MKHVIVVKPGLAPFEEKEGVTIDDLETLETGLEEGAIGAFAYKDQAVLILDSDPSEIVERIIPVYNTGEPVLRKYAGLIPGKFKVGIRYYTPPTPKVDTITISSFTDLSVGSEYGIEITDLNAPTYKNRMERVVAVVKSADATEITIAADLANRINSNPKLSKVLVATVDDDDLILTGISNFNFKTRMLGILYGSTIVEGDFVRESGGYSDVAEFERQGQFAVGRTETNTTEPSIWKANSFAAKNVTYDALVIEYMNSSGRTGYGVPSDNLSPGELVIYIPSDDFTDYSDFIDILEAQSGSDLVALNTAVVEDVDPPQED